jgi:hypothetical protein
MRHLKSNTIKWVFLFFVIYLPVQYMLIGLAGIIGSELWPSFALPGFKKVPTTEQRIQVVKPVFYIVDAESSTETKINANELFEGLQTSQVQGFIRTNFSQPKQYPTAAKRWLQSRTELLYPNNTARALVVRWKLIVYEQADSDVVEVNRETLRVITVPF